MKFKKVFSSRAHAHGGITKPRLNSHLHRLAVSTSIESSGKMLNEPRNSDDPPMPVCEQCGEKFGGDPEDKLCPDCREQNAPDDDDGDDGDDFGLGIL